MSEHSGTQGDERPPAGTAEDPTEGTRPSTGAGEAGSGAEPKTAPQEGADPDDARTGS